MKAGLMRRTLAFERPDNTTRDAFQGVVKTWLPVATVAASVDAISGREFFSADRELAGLTWRIVVREMPGEKPEPGWRATDVDTGDVFDVRAILPSHLRNVLTMAASSGATQP